jgi:hypothetical protein
MDVVYKKSLASLKSKNKSIYRCKVKTLAFLYILCYNAINDSDLVREKRVKIMKCPFCGCSESKVIDSRPTDENERIRRRRECIDCGKRFTTYEIIEDVPIIVIKKDKSREVFDRNKVLKGMLRVCEKRPLPPLSLTLGFEIEATLQSAN